LCESAQKQSHAASALSHAYHPKKPRRPRRRRNELSSWASTARAIFCGAAARGESARVILEQRRISEWRQHSLDPVENFLRYGRFPCKHPTTQLPLTDDLPAIARYRRRNSTVGTRKSFSCQPDASSPHVDSTVSQGAAHRPSDVRHRRRCCVPRKNDRASSYAAVVSASTGACRSPSKRVWLGSSSSITTDSRWCQSAPRSMPLAIVHLSSEPPCFP
jgi:hypothetical protein